MSKPALLDWRLIHTIVLDFDGVFTDNKVWVDQDGKESVRCDRGDGLGFDMLRSFSLQKGWDLRYFILSKETNNVVSSRALKIRVPCVQGVQNKADYLIDYLKDNKMSSEGLVFVGNDLNDLASMRLSGFSFAPSDAHPLVRNEATFVFPQNGGEGFVRAFIESLLGIDSMTADELIRSKLI